MVSESRKSFHEELDEIRSEITRLGALTCDRVARATEALLDSDLVAAQRLIDEDDSIDLLALTIEERCQSVLLLQNPVAGDLRRVITALWITGEFERSADLASNICKAARRIFGHELAAISRGQISRMSTEAVRLCEMAVDAYAESNDGLAAALPDIDDRLDDLHADYIEDLFRQGSTPGGNVQPIVQMALIGRFYERIGDHAVNVGDRVRYMVSGVLPEQTGAARAEWRAENEPLDDA